MKDEGFKAGFYTKVQCTVQTYQLNRVLKVSAATVISLGLRYKVYHLNIYMYQSLYVTKFIYIKSLYLTKVIHHEFCK
jgi:hypothetical protein